MIKNDNNINMYKGEQTRYDLSNFSFRQLHNDHIRFKHSIYEKYPKLPYSFIGNIIYNYICYAQESFFEDFKNGVCKRINEKRPDDYITEDRFSFTAELDKKLWEFDFIYNDNCFKKRRHLVTYILDEYTSLQLSEREKVFFYFQYKEIVSAIDKQESLIVVNSKGTEFEVKPCIISVDDSSLSYYLVGYSRHMGSNDEFGCHSIKLSRIKRCWSTCTAHDLTEKKKREAKDIMEKFGSAYMVSGLTPKNIGKSVVRLTKIGYEQLFLNSISHHRPFPVSMPTEVMIDSDLFYELEFDCSHRQIENYFTSYGAEAEIIEPDFLRRRLADKYRLAAEKYNK